jgi:hypothetical protein
MAAFGCWLVPRMRAKSRFSEGRETLSGFSPLVSLPVTIGNSIQIQPVSEVFLKRVTNTQRRVLWHLSQKLERRPPLGHVATNT